jgi:two-component system, NtrC family, sensor histidine kinase HydH
MTSAPQRNPSPPVATAKVADYKVILRVAVIVAIIAFTLSLHYMWLPVPHSIHLLHRRLCYIPIILGALWFGLRGGVGSALAISLAVLPLALEKGGDFWTNEEFVEIVFYFSIGTLAGFLVDRGHRERDKKQRLELELVEAERLASAGRTAAGIAHEVRTPLASVRGSVEILAEDYPDSHPRRPYFDILAKETGRLKQVMDEFLDLNRPVSIAVRATNLRPFLGECLETLRPLAESKGVTLRLETPGTCTLPMDPDRMRQVVTNLLRNAIQASPEGGAVSLAWARREGAASVAVEDGGPGIPETDLGRIFEPFFTRRREGVGLGLTLARQIAVAHGGSLEASNRPQGGARFTLRLPEKPI